jgi:hypothetical protein
MALRRPSGEQGCSCLSALHSWLAGWRAAWCVNFVLYLAVSRLTLPLCRQSLLVLKYILPDYPEQFTYYGYANVSQNVALMLSSVVLWIAQSAQGEYDYSLTL